MSTKTSSPMSSFGGLLSALAMAGRDDLADKLTPDADPRAIEEVRRALLDAREPHRVKLARFDFALAALGTWEAHHRRCSCGAPAVVETREGPLCLAGFVVGGKPHKAESVD